MIPLNSGLAAIQESMTVSPNRLLVNGKFDRSPNTRSSGKTCIPADEREQIIHEVEPEGDNREQQKTDHGPEELFDRASGAHDSRQVQRGEGRTDRRDVRSCRARHH